MREKISPAQFIGAISYHRESKGFLGKRRTSYHLHPQLCSMLAAVFPSRGEAQMASGEFLFQCCMTKSLMPLSGHFWIYGEVMIR